MPPRESLRPVTNADVDEFVRIRASRGERSARLGSRAPIVEADISWFDPPAPRSRRRHPVADADDWGGGAWVVEPHERRPVHEREAEAFHDWEAEPVHPRGVERAQWEAEAVHWDAEAVHDWEVEPVHRREVEAIHDWEAEDLLADASGPGGSEPWSGSEPSSADSGPSSADSEHLPGDSEPLPYHGAPELAAPDFGLIVDGAAIGVSRIDRAVTDVSPISPTPTDVAPVSPAASETLSGDPPSAPGERRTVVITGRGAEGRLPRGRGWEASLPLHERSSFRPDRLALWAVLLGVLLLLVAATSSHAAILASHHIP